MDVAAQEVEEQQCATHWLTGWRWKGQRRGVFSICCTDAAAGGSLQAALLQEPRGAPHPLGGCLEAVDLGGAWLWEGPPVPLGPPPGFGEFWMALEGTRDHRRVWS